MGHLVALRRRRVDEVFCSGLVPEAAEAQLCAIARYHPPGGVSVDEFLQHMLQLQTSRGSSATTGWSNSSARPRARRPGCTDGSLRQRVTAPPLPRVPAGTSWPPSA